MHLLFKFDPRVKNWSNRGGPGIDTRSAGGYIVAPPSVHPNGHAYRWPDGYAPGEMSIATAPAWLLDLLDPPRPEPVAVPFVPRSTKAATRYAEKAFEAELERVAYAAPGERNNSLNRAAFALGQLAGHTDEVEFQVRRREEQLRLLAHDLRQPLNVLALAADRLASVVEHDAEARPLSESINASIRAMSRVLEDILEADERDAVSVRRERVEIGPFLRELLTGSVAPEGLLRLRVEFAGACTVEADPTKLGRALLNLVDNALKFSPADAPVVIQVGREAGVLRIAVSDSGPGLTGEDAARAFDRGRASQGSRAAGGRGLGLYAARLIAEAHGGRCEVASAPGQGAIFAIELPCAGPPAIDRR